MAPQPVFPWRDGAAKPKKPSATEQRLRQPDQVVAARGTRAAAAARPILPTTRAGVRLPWREGVNAETVKARKDIEDKPGGVAGNLTGLAHLIEATPTALVTFGKEVAKDRTLNPVHELVRGFKDPFGNRQDVRRPSAGPVLTETGRSIGRTAERVATDPGQYREAYNRGELANLLVEDIANLSIVGGALSAPLRGVATRAAGRATAARAAESAAVAEVIAGRAPAASLAEFSGRATAADAAARRVAGIGRVGEGIHTAARLGAQAGDAPILPIQWAGRGIRKLGDIPIRGATLGARLGESPVGRGISRAASATQARYAARDLIADEVQLPTSQATHDIMAPARQAAKGLTEAEDQAGGLLSEGVLSTPQELSFLRQAVDLEGPEAIVAFTQRLNEKSGAGTNAAYAIKPEAVQTVLDYREGRLAPEQVAKLDAATAALGGISETLTPIQQAGRVTGPMSPEMLGTELLTDETVNAPAVLKARREVEAAAVAREKAAKKAEVEAGRAAQREADVEGRQATTVARIEAASPRQAALEGRRQRALDEADLRREQAVGARLTGDVRAARAVEDAQRRAAGIDERADALPIRPRRNLEARLTEADEFGAGAERMSTAAGRGRQVAEETAPRTIPRPAQPVESAVTVRGKAVDAAGRALEDLATDGFDAGVLDGTTLRVTDPDRLAWKLRGSIDILKDNLNETGFDAATRRAWRSELSANERLLAQVDALPRPPVAAPPPPLTGRPARLIRQAERQEATRGRLVDRQGRALSSATEAFDDVVAAVGKREAEVMRAEAVRQAGEVRASAIADAANDAGDLLEGRATAAEARHAGMADQTPLRDVAEREVGRAARAGEKAGRAGERSSRTERTLEKSLRAEERAKLRLAKAEAAALESLDAVPPRYRYAVATAREAHGALGELIDTLEAQGAGEHVLTPLRELKADFPTSLKALVDAGVDPIYLPGGFDPYAGSRTGRVANLQHQLGGTQSEFGLTKRKLGSENARQTELRPVSIKGKTAAAVKEVHQAIKNIASDKVSATQGVSAESVLGHRPTPNELRGKGEALRQEMRAQGYEAFDPRLPDSTPPAITADTVFLPADFKRAYGNYFKPDGNFEVYMQALADPVRQTWKHMVLPVSGQWHVGNIISNMVMNTIGTGGLGWVKELRTALKAVRAEGHGVAGVPARNFGLMPEHDLAQWMRGQTGKEPGVVMRQLNRSYAFNTFIDDWSRSAVFLSEQKGGLRRGLSVSAAERQALDTALKVSGDFTNLTQFERKFVRRAMPFYTWSRHITQLVAHLAIENPIRLAWTLNLAKQFGPQEGGPFGDSFEVGNGLLSVGNLSPLGSFQNLWLNDRGPAAGVVQALGPELDVGAAALLGINLGRGGQGLRLPPGASRLDEFGNEINTPLIGRPGSLASYAVRQVPLVNTARQLWEGGKLAEYDTGQPIVKGGRVLESTPTIYGTDISGRAGILARQLGGLTTTPFDVEGIMETAQGRRESAAKARARYQKNLANALAKRG